MDLDILTVPEHPHDQGREIFEPVNAWPNASGTIYVSTYRCGPVAVFQVGYDPDSELVWFRSLPAPEHRWTDWIDPTNLPAPPTEEETNA